MKYFFNIFNVNHINLIPLVLWVIVHTGSLNATDVDSLFRADDVIHLELHSDFKLIQEERMKNAEYHPGVMIYYSPDGKQVKLSVKISVRGHFRRDTANCNFPPLYLNFKKSETRNTIFDNQNELKLVTPCIYEKDVIDEFLIYKMYNLVTDLSLKVRLVKVLYYDTGSGKKLFEKLSFFLEKEKKMAERNNCTVRDTMLSSADIDRENYKKMAIFQYMIGNGDWYLRMKVGIGQQYLKLNRNLIIIESGNKANAPFVVPYDFDLSSMVDADYAKSMRSKRKYKGLCYSETEFQEVFRFYQDLRPKFELLIMGMEYLSRSSRKSLIKYIDGFYEIIGDKRLIKQEFLDGCSTASSDLILKID